ncbi:MAG: YvcK family protein [Candidatus Curtissbacteria bacterium]|nr:YvcK family protein [Candidatus Curtissbacteria bacterium]
MFRQFFRHYLELPPKNLNVVCLGGGVGTAQILKGLRSYPYNLTAIVSMADDGGSAGRLRRAFSVPPAGDLVNCLAALSEEESTLTELFLYRFAGKRYGKDTDLGGHKLGNLIFVALTDIYKGDTTKALVEFSKIISAKGKVLPATLGDVNIWGKTKKGKKVYGEQNMDLGKYGDGRVLEEVHLDPPNIEAYSGAVKAIKEADIIIAGPGDLFTTVIPVLIVPEITKELKESTAQKIFIVNTTNKPFETAGFKVSDYLKALERHLGGKIFDRILANTNTDAQIPKKLKYTYVEYDIKNLKGYEDEITGDDFVNSSYPLYHDSGKVAKYIESTI